MKIGKHKIDLPQAVVLGAIILGACAVVALVLTWGPSDSRSLIAEWGGAIGGVLGSIYLALKGGILTVHDDAGKATAPRRTDGPGGAVALLVVAAAVTAAAGATGCGGVPREARLGVEQLAVGLDHADVIAAARVATRGDAARRQVLEETVADLLTTVEAGLARFEELIGGEVALEAALRGAHSALLTVEAALDAWDAGAADAGFLAAAACCVVALGTLADTFDALGLELPDEVTSGLRFLAAFASGACPAPETSGGEALLEVTS